MDESTLTNIAYDPTIEIKNIFLVNSHTLQLCVEKKSHSLRPNRNANMYIIAKICAEARSILDQAIRQLDSVGAQILYVG